MNPSIYIVDASVGVKQFIPDLLTSKVNQLLLCLSIQILKYLYPTYFI